MDEEMYPNDADNYREINDEQLIKNAEFAKYPLAKHAIY
jgi:hypothetical protein